MRVYVRRVRILVISRFILGLFQNLVYNVCVLIEYIIILCRYAFVIGERMFVFVCGRSPRSAKTTYAEKQNTYID